MSIDWEKQRKRRWENVNEKYLWDQLALKVALAQNGWFEFPEPEEGLGTAIAHQSDFETYIVGYVNNDSIVLDPGEDFVRIYARDYLTLELFIEGFKTEFDRLVKVWFPE